MTATFPELSLKLGGRRNPCVLDPALVLGSALGPTMVRRLGEFVDLWMPPSLFRVLDSSEFYRDNSDALARLTGAEPAAAEQALRTWERIRNRSDLSGLRFHWLADSFHESSVPAATEPDLVQRYERLSAALACRFDLDDPETYLLRAIAVDVAAMAAALGPTLVLTHAAQAGPPALVAALQAGGLSCSRIEAEADDLARCERERSRELILHAGLVPLTWAGLRLAAAHLLVPGAAELRTPVDVAMAEGPDPEFSAPQHDFDDNDPAQDSLWSGAQLFWYPL